MSHCLQVGVASTAFHLIVLSDYGVVITRDNVGLCDVPPDKEREPGAYASADGQRAIDVRCRLCTQVIDLVPFCVG